MQDWRCKRLLAAARGMVPKSGRAFQRTDLRSKCSVQSHFARVDLFLVIPNRSPPATDSEFLEDFCEALARAFLLALTGILLFGRILFLFCNAGSAVFQGSACTFTSRRPLVTAAYPASRCVDNIMWNRRRCRANPAEELPDSHLAQSREVASRNSK